jgi:DNA-binding transcriptional ArsR family regulator
MYLFGYIAPVDEVLHALADESRRTMLEILRNHPATVGELAEAVPIARPGVSRHLRVLREAGLVEVEQEAQWRIYRLRPESLAELDGWLGRYRVMWEHQLDALHTEVARGKRAQRRMA